MLKPDIPVRIHSLVTYNSGCTCYLNFTKRSNSPTLWFRFLHSRGFETSEKLELNNSLTSGPKRPKIRCITLLSPLASTRKRTGKNSTLRLAFRFRNRKILPLKKRKNDYSFVDSGERQGLLHLCF